MCSFEKIETLKGKVIKCDLTLLSFTINIETKIIKSHIHCALQIKTKFFNFPEVDDEIFLTNLIKDKHGGEHHYFLTPNSQFRFKTKINQKKLNADESLFLQLVKKHALTLEHLKCFHMFYPNYDVGCETDSSMLKFVFLKYLLETQCTLDKQKNLPVPTFKTSSMSKYTAENCEYLGSTPFSHGVHHTRINEYFVGFLFTDDFPSLKLSDGKSTMACKIITDNKDFLFFYINHIVVIKKFTICTEMYEDNVQYEYILFHQNDMHVLLKQESHVEKCDIKTYVRKTPTSLFHKIDFILLKIALPNTRENGANECWIVVKLLSPKEEIINICLTEYYFNIIPFLDVGNSYILFLKKQCAIEKYEYSEMKRVNYYLQSFRLLPDFGIFMRQQWKPKQFHEIFSLEQLLVNKHKYLKRTLSFEAVVTLRTFNKMDESSRTKRHRVDSNYGTPGNNQHVVHFATVDRSQSINLYFNNWEHKQFPLGIVPQMRVIVRDALVAKTYLMSNAVTSFELLGLECAYLYNTINLNPENREVFFSPLGIGHFVPYDVIVRAKCIFKQIKKFQVNFDDNDKLEIKSQFCVVDDFGEALVFCNSESLLKEVMDVNDILYHRFLNVAKYLRSFDIYNESAPHLDPIMRKVYNAIITFFRLKFNGSNFYIEMICKRKEPKQDEERNADKPAWIAIDILKVYQN